MGFIRFNGVYIGRMSYSVSAGICAHNEEATIGALIEQVMAADIDWDSVIVVSVGDDDTVPIVRRKAEKYAAVEAVIEDRRRGQTAAVNEILCRVDTDLLFLIDGDGLLKDGSLERLLDTYTNGSVLYGQEVPVIRGGLLRYMNSFLWDAHHHLCQTAANFSGQLCLFPRDLVDALPKGTVLDDEYLGLQAERRGMTINYVPQAVKYHFTRSSFRFYFHQRRKNWAGRFQLQDNERITLHSTGDRIRCFLNYLRTHPQTFPQAVLVGAVEAAAYAAARYDAFTGKLPVIWKRD